MTLTVPRAGNIAGRAANVAGANPPAPVLGGLVEQLGSNIAERQAKLKLEQDAITQQRTQLDMARELGQARQEVDQISDPVAVEQTWTERAKDIRARYVDQIEDPDLRGRLDLAFTEMNDRHGLAVGSRAINLTRSQREAVWIDSRATITAEAARADEESFGILLELADASIEERLAAGDLDPATAAEQKQALRGDVYRARANQAISDDPEGFLAATAGASDYDVLGDGVAGLRLTAEREIARRADAAAKEADKAMDAQKKALKSRLTDQTSIFNSGLQASDEALLTDPAVLSIVQADPDLQKAHAEAMAAKSLRDELPNIRQMTPAQLRAEVQRERAQPKDQPFQGERVKVLESWLTTAEREWQADGVKAARAAGFNLADLPDLDPADPTDFAAAIDDRLSFDAWQRKNGYGGQAVFSGEEAARLKTVLAPEAPVEPKLALAEAIAAGAGPEARRVVGLVSSDPVFSRALNLIQQTGDRALAAEMLTGQQKEKLGTIGLPPKPQRQLTFAVITGGGLSADPAREAEIFEAASALYAARAAGVNPDGADSVLPFKDDDQAQQIFAQAVAEVTGAKPDRNGALTVGGLQDVNGAMVMLPKGMPRDVVTDAWEKIDRQLRGAVWDDRYQTWSFSGEAGDPLRALRGASIDPGAAPALGANARAQWSNARLRQVGESDVYELVISRNGRDTAVPVAGDDLGRAFRFRLPALIEGAQR